MPKKLTVKERLKLFERRHDVRKASLVVMDDEGQAIKTATPERVIQYVELGQVDGDDEAHIGITWDDEAGNRVGESLSRTEAKAWL